MLLRPLGAMNGCRGDCGPAGNGWAARGLPRNGWTEPANGSWGIGTAGVLAAEAEPPSPTTAASPVMSRTGSVRRRRPRVGVRMPRKVRRDTRRLLPRRGELQPDELVQRP